jgi:putative peptide zinc metalloprotease protein
LVSLADSLVSSTSRPVSLRMRPDLSVKRQTYQGRSFWVVKEPIGLNYYRFHDEEFSILNMMDGHTSMDRMKEEFESQFAPQKVTFQDLQHFIGQLHRSGLVISDAPGQGRQLRHRRDTKKRKELMGKFTNVFALRWRGIDPERILNRLYPFTGWFFSWLTVCFVVALATSALTLVAVQFDVFQSKMPTFHQFFGAHNWIYLGTSMAVVKVLHEFGHGLTCKRYGGECHEMGFMLLVFTPALYCNVSDSWMLPNKWHRIFIGAGGMYVEMCIASASTYVWWFSQPGLLNQLALSLMFVCSVSTLMFNGNPLLRFDGYYILMDLIEIPNLRQKATEVLKRFAVDVCLGIEQPESPFLPKRNHFFFGLYTVAAVIYRWLIVFSIFMFLNQVLEPYGLKVLGQLMGAMGVFGLVVQPVWQMGKFFYTPGRMHKVKKHRLAATVGVVATFVGVVCLVPFEYHIDCAVRLVPREYAASIQSVGDETDVSRHEVDYSRRLSATVFAQANGRLVEMNVTAGSWVDKGDLIARIENEDIQILLIKLKNALAEAEARQVILKKQRGVDPQAPEELVEVRETIESLRNQLAKQEIKAELLLVNAPIAGVVIPANFKPSQGGAGNLPGWSGYLLDRENLGASIAPEDAVCRIATPRDDELAAAKADVGVTAVTAAKVQMDAELVVDQADIELIKSGNLVEICLELAPNTIYETVIRDISFATLVESPANLTSQSGGQLGTVLDSSGRARPVSPSYYARAPMDVSAALLYQVDLRGQAKIYPQQKRSLGWRLYRYAARTFHFQM